MTILLRRSFAALGVISVLSLNACTDAHSHANTSPAAAVDQAVQRTLAKSALVTMTNTLTPPASGSIVVSMHGSYDFSAGAGHLTVTLPGAAGGNREVEELFTKDTLYVRSTSEVYTGLPQGKWGALPVALAKAHYILRTPGNNPAILLEQAGELVHLSKVGAEKINGSATTRYRGTVTRATFEKYATAKLLSSEDLLFENGDISCDIWVDGSGLVTRTRSDWPATGQAAPIGTLQLDLTDFGVQVSGAPPAATTTAPVRDVSGILTG